ncbi:NAD(P)-dependent oxidoreductase [Streptomyces sp. Da 82-17]|uniref:NAD(P)-dependent oxidoreductase n=1 Tax=Streptomyces sp. Da 82-17 TaxID=3377116 RepID=UPI0038D4594E
MNIAVLGATGMVGSRVVAEAVSRGHQVIAASRRPGTAAAPGVTSVAVDAGGGDPASLDRALDKADVAVLAVRPAPGQEDTLAPMTVAVLDAAARTGVPVLVVGGAAPLDSPAEPGLSVLDDPRYVAAQWRAIAEASTRQLQACAEHPYDAWTYVSPPALLEPGARTGRYRRGTTTLLTGPDGSSRISAEDLAVAVLDELERPGGVRHFTVAEETSAPGR